MPGAGPSGTSPFPGAPIEGGATRSGLLRASSQLAHAGHHEPSASVARASQVSEST